MINKISNLKLILGLVILVLAYLAVVYFDSPKSAPLEKQLVTIDTSLVTQIIIETADEQVNLTKVAGSWLVKLPSGKNVAAVSSKVTGLLEQLLNIGTDRLAAREEAKWADYQVDSTGTVLQVHQGDELTLDMVAGQSGSTSYLRLAGEVEVYASDDFEGLNTIDHIGHYRDNTVLQMQTDSIESITFNYPADSSFQLSNQGSNWTMDSQLPVDSTKMVEYLRNFSLKYNDNFAYQDGSSLGSQIAEIIISIKGQPSISLAAFNDPSDSVVYNSSVNPEAYFNDIALGEEYFIGKTELIISLD